MKKVLPALIAAGLASSALVAAQFGPPDPKVLKVWQRPRARNLFRHPQTVG